MGSRCPTHLWEPPGEVVHDHGCNQCLAKAGRQADKRVVQQRRLDDGQLVGALLNPQRVHPCLGVQPATLLQYDVLIVCRLAETPTEPVLGLTRVFIGAYLQQVLSAACHEGSTTFCNPFLEGWRLSRHVCKFEWLHMASTGLPDSARDI